MVAQGSDFFAISQDIAEQFLQTAVIIDDLAEFSDHSGDKEEIKVVPPITRQKAPEDAVELNKEAESIEDDKSHFLDAKTVTDQFAQKGIVCSILKPNNREELTSMEETFIRLASCADIIILDWQLHKDEGKLAQNVISRIAQNQKPISKKLRLITIYTGQSGIFGIVKKVKERLSSHDIKVVQENKSTPILIVDSIKIIVLAKKSSGVIKSLEPYQVDFSELAERVTQEFTSMTAGLISNAVLLALATIRKNTFKIINNFSKDLDAPFLTHRALQVDPRDAEEHLNSLISEEIQAILEEAQISQEATNLNVIKNWFDGVQFELPSETSCVPDATARKLKQHGDISDITQKVEKITNYFAQNQEMSSYHKNDWQENIKKHFDDLDQSDLNQINLMQRMVKDWIESATGLTIFYKNITLKQIYSLLEYGIDNWQDGVSSIKKKKQKTPFTKLFSFTLSQSDNDEQFALATSTRTFYGDKARKLTLGTIVKYDLDDNSQYLLCVQPKCDTYRLVKPRVFLFLPLSLVSEGKQFNFVVKADGAYQRLALEKKPYQLVLLEFAPNKKVQIVITEDGEYTATDGKKYEWIAELRFEHAQRISNRLATELSRVGVKESQWLRRWAKE